MEPAHMSDKHADANAVMSGGVHGQHHSVNDEYMPKSVWQPGVVRRLADYIRHLREVDNEPNERTVSHQPGFARHVCTRNPHRTCNCDAGICADDAATYRYARGPFLPACGVDAKQSSSYHCPISGTPCAKYECRDWCESGVDYSKT